MNRLIFYIFAILKSAFVLLDYTILGFEKAATSMKEDKQHYRARQHAEENRYF